jgi:hypothetical protein
MPGFTEVKIALKIIKIWITLEPAVIRSKMD